MEIYNINKLDMLEEENKESSCKLFLVSITICKQNVENTLVLFVLSTYLPVLVLYIFKGRVTKIELSTFYNEYHSGLENFITSLPPNTAKFLDAFNQMKKFKCK